MTLRIYNTLTRATEDFSPLEAGHVRMYLCGITVYDLCHVGHARCNIAFDVVQRWLKASGLRVTFVRNVTENGETVRGLADRMTAEMHKDFDLLGMERPTHEPRATDFIPQMLEIVGRLEANKLAYRAQPLHRMRHAWLELLPRVFINRRHAHVHAARRAPRRCDGSCELPPASATTASTGPRSVGCSG